MKHILWARRVFFGKGGSSRPYPVEVVVPAANILDASGRISEECMRWCESGFGPSNFVVRVIGNHGFFFFRHDSARVVEFKLRFG